METKWLEDFVSLAETRSFSRSAEARHLTQPAYSRRIKALEAWVGTELIDRSTYPTKLTPAGEVFYEQALGMLAQINGVHALLRGRHGVSVDTIEFATPHALSLSFFPKWLSAIESSFGPIHGRLIAGNVHDAVLMLVEGGCDLLLCYHHPDQPVPLDPARYEMLLLGTEVIHAYSGCDRDGKPLYLLPGKPNAPLPFLSYSNSAYLGRMVELILQRNARKLYLKTRFETDMAEGLKMMALEGHGIAFLPDGAVQWELARNQLARAGRDDLSIAMEIRLYRECRCTRAVVNQLWQHLAQRTTSNFQQPSAVLGSKTVSQATRPATPTETSQKLRTRTALEVASRFAKPGRQI
jgi:DNA-binding transcriptional LysR family regulator